MMNHVKSCMVIELRVLYPLLSNRPHLSCDDYALSCTTVVRSDTYTPM